MTFGLRSVVGAAVLGVGVLGGCSPADEQEGTKGSQAGSSSTTAGSGGAAAGSGNATAGSGGTPSAAGSPAAGGSAGSTAGNAAGGSAAGSTAVGGGAGGSGGGGGVLCPVDNTFCSGFEESAQPPKAVYKYNAADGPWTRDFEVDTTLFHSGKSSLRVKSGGADTGASGAYQMLAVPAPADAFWVRFYIQQTEFDIGLNDMGGAGEHNVFAGASDSDKTNPNIFIEFAEDIGIAFNTSDDVRTPMGFGRVNGTPMPFSLPKGVWHCIEINYDGPKREQKLFINGTQQIDATDYPKTVASPINTFKFGFIKLHGPARKVWFDDVAVGPTRAGCL
jgi:hypothetical protein